MILHPPTAVPQFYKALIQLKSKALNGQILDTREVLFYVPPARVVGGVR